MRLAEWVHAGYLNSYGIRHEGWSRFREILIKTCNDPLSAADIHGRRLYLPLSHQLPEYLRNPYYDRLLTRLSQFLRIRHKDVIAIDVGANIGDTVAAMYSPVHVADRFLAVEPNPKFSSYLQMNWGPCENVTIVHVACSSACAHAELEFVEHGGTASANQASGGVQIEVTTVDELVRKHGAFTDVNLIKIDTDGFDFEVLGGATGTLAQNHPAVLFECDAFHDAGYVKKCLAALERFRASGYRSFLVYDNRGYLMGRHSLDRLQGFQQLLYYQLTSHFYYFDILVLEESDMLPFCKSEMEVFSASVRDTAQHAAACDAAPSLLF